MVLENISYFILSCVYIPPCSPIIMSENMFSALSEVNNSNLALKIVLLNDFNLPSLSWSLDTNNHPQIESYFVSMLSYFNLSQLNYIPNYNNVM